MPPSSAPTHNPEYDSRFTCNVLGDNAREYVLKADRSVFDIADPFYLLVLVATAAVLVRRSPLHHDGESPGLDPVPFSLA